MQFTPNKRKEEDDCLSRSLKRVRLSSSPGELCLQRDIRFLTRHYWVEVDYDTWRYGQHTLKLDGPFILELTSCGQFSCTLTLSRFYPHRPPVIKNVRAKYYREIVLYERYNEIQQQQQQQHDNRVAYVHWTPVLRLDELVDCCIKLLLSSKRCNEADCATEKPDMHMHDDSESTTNKPSKNASSKSSQPFTPNRFDWGFDRTASMHCDQS